MKTISIYIFSILVLSSCGQDPFKARTNSPSYSTAQSASNSASKVKEGGSGDCICTAQYEPVCGVDGKTYSNVCQAQCAGLSEFEQGACPN